VKRREFITLLGGAVMWPIATQVPSKRPTIACLSGGTRQDSESFIENFLQGMSELCYVGGRRFDMICRFTDGFQERLPALTEVVQLKPNIILAPAVIGAVAAKKATSTIPIVSPALADAVHLGDSQRSEAGRQRYRDRAVCGGSARKTTGGRPRDRTRCEQIGLLTNLEDPKAPAQAQELEASARAAKIKTIAVDANHPGDVERSLSDEKVDVVIVLQTSLLLTSSRQIAASALEKRLPTVYGYREHVVALWAGRLSITNIALRQARGGRSQSIQLSRRMR
jgi:putative ABC transport system substrate-binding protein